MFFYLDHLSSNIREIVWMNAIHINTWIINRKFTTVSILKYVYSRSVCLLFYNCWCSIHEKHLNLLVPTTVRKDSTTLMPWASIPWVSVHDSRMPRYQPSTHTHQHSTTDPSTGSPSPAGRQTTSTFGLRLVSDTEPPPQEFGSYFFFQKHIRMSYLFL